MEYDEDFKRRVAKEALEVGNNTAVARKNGINEGSIRNWIKKYYEQTEGNTQRKGLKEYAGINGISKDLNKAKKQVEDLTKIVGEKEVEILVLRDLLKKLNIPLPQRKG
jgi:transposase-like protein